MILKKETIVLITNFNSNFKQKQTSWASWKRNTLHEVSFGVNKIAEINKNRREMKDNIICIYMELKDV